MRNDSKVTLILSVVLAIFIGAVLALVVGTASAGASEEECIPSDAIPAQHYSWTGGNLPTSTPPTEVPPSDNWQANTTIEPHKHATWVNEALHYTHASEQAASWFYFQAAVDEVTCESESPTPPPTTDPPPPTWTPSWTPTPPGHTPPVPPAPTSGNLPNTGLDVTDGLILVGALLALGLGSLYFGRRRFN